MIAIRREDGVEVNIQTSHDPVEVDRFVSRILQPETYALMKKQLIKGEEIFFEFTGANNDELPQVRHCLIHLDSLSRGTGNLSRGDFYIIFHVHKDNLLAAQEMAKTLKHRFKDANDWHETNEHGIPADKFFAIPPTNLK